MLPFKDVAGLKPRRSVFNNSYYKQFDCDIGRIIPIFCDLFLPGDMVKISAEALARMNPAIAPLMHRIDLKADYYAVPIRLLWPKPDYKDDEGVSLGYSPDASSWEEFITGGVTGKLEPVQPKWAPAPYETGLYSLWDYMGLPLQITAPINAWPKRAYNLIYNEYFRQPDFEDPVDLDAEGIHKAKYEKDYFTSALWDTQRGTAPSIPLSGTGVAKFNIPPGVGGTQNWNVQMPGTSLTVYPQLYGISGSDGLPETFSKMLSDNNQIDLTNVGTFDSNDLRWIIQIQKHLERSMRAGSRLTEHILAHWKVHNGDARLQRPEYIGGIRSPIIVSEVLQTGQSTTGVDGSPQGNLAGHGIGTSQSYVGSYYCREHMIIIGVMRLMPKPAYQQGINRQWLYETRFDYPTPELVNLGEQGIYNMELLATGIEGFDKDIFGYQGRYDEHRVKHNMVCGALRSTAPDSLAHWHLARVFDYSSPPALNKEFLEVNDDKRYLAVQNRPGWIVTFGNNVRRVAPLPEIGMPGFMDHH